jgi:hypothetical protein
LQKLVGQVAVELPRGNFRRASRLSMRAASDTVPQHGLQTVKDTGFLCLGTETIAFGQFRDNLDHYSEGAMDAHTTWGKSSLTRL